MANEHYDGGDSRVHNLRLPDYLSPAVVDDVLHIFHHCVLNCHGIRWRGGIVQDDGNAVVPGAVGGHILLL